MRTLEQRFAYIFDERMRPLPGTTKPEGDAHDARRRASRRTIAGDARDRRSPCRTGTPRVRLSHRRARLRHRCEATPAEAIDALRGVKVLVLNALFWTRASDAPERARGDRDGAHDVGAERTYLTHLTHDNFHAELEAALPAGIFPAYDGLTVDDLMHAGSGRRRHPILALQPLPLGVGLATFLLLPRRPRTGRLETTTSEE